MRGRLFPRGYGFTVLGIAVGVAGLVALGAMAERISRFIEGGDRFVLGQISVAGEGMGMGAGFTAGGLLPAARMAEIARVPGVAIVQPQVMLPDQHQHVALPHPHPGAADGRGSGRASRQSPLPVAPGTVRAGPSPPATGRWRCSGATSPRRES